MVDREIVRFGCMFCVTRFFLFFFDNLLFIVSLTLIHDSQILIL